MISCRKYKMIAILKSRSLYLEQIVITMTSHQCKINGLRYSLVYVHCIVYFAFSEYGLLCLTLV